VGVGEVPAAATVIAVVTALVAALLEMVVEGKMGTGVAPEKMRGEIHLHTGQGKEAAAEAVAWQLVHHIQHLGDHRSKCQQMDEL